jgi:hypothetical protein
MKKQCVVICKKKICGYTWVIITVKVAQAYKEADVLPKSMERNETLKGDC